MYVDDLVLATSSEQNLLLLINYAIALFGLFGFTFKEANVSHLGKRSTQPQSSEAAPSSTQAESADDGLAAPNPIQAESADDGYKWSAKEDDIKLKTPVISNGKKSRGRLVASDRSTPLIKEELKSPKQMNLERINGIFHSKEKTLRSLVQVTSCHFDPLGLTAPLISQIRHTVSLAMRQTKAAWDTKLSDKIWQFAMRQMVELGFPRFPKGFSSKRGKSVLVIKSDVSISIVIAAFLVVFQEDGSAEINLIQTKSFLAASVATIPQRELHGVSLACQFCRQLVSELGALISTFFGMH